MINSPKHQSIKKPTRKPFDSELLYLTALDITNLPSFTAWKHLRIIWVNGNKLKSLGDAFAGLCGLTELYAHDNQLLDISGSLSYLTCLQIVTLHKNQLTDIAGTASEMRFMRSLRKLSLYNNPLAYEPDYRIFFIDQVPSLQLLDLRAVAGPEREQAAAVFKADRQLVKDRVSFLRAKDNLDVTQRIAKPVALPDQPCTQQLAGTEEAQQAKATTTSQSADDTPVTLEEAVRRRHQAKATWEFSQLDWKAAPMSHQLRLQPTLATPIPQLVVQKFK